MAKKKFRDLATETMSPESRARAALKAKVMLEELRLGELRRARQLSQEELADRLGTTQPEVSKLERRTDVYVSTLRKYVRAMGGELEIVARFPTGAVRLSLFSELAAQPEAPVRPEPYGSDINEAYTIAAQNINAVTSLATEGAALSENFHRLLSHIPSHRPIEVPGPVQRRSAVPAIPPDPILDSIPTVPIDDAAQGIVMAPESAQRPLAETKV